MGCIGSKERRSRAYAVEEPDSVEFHKIDKDKDVSTDPSSTQATKTVQPNTGNIVNIPRPKLDPKDFQFVNCKDEIKIKTPGSINGQSFIIDKCENCDIYILDYCGQVTIDNCKGCRLYIGPTDGAVFVRDSADCNLAVVCRQLRTRDCSGCNIALYCRTKPIVESSSNMGFSCLDLSYPDLKSHMRHAKLSLFHNFWYDIFDFTPKDGNWRLLPHGTKAATLLEPIPSEVAELLEARQEVNELGTSTPAQQPPLLLTVGGSPAQHEQPAINGLSYMFVAFDGAKHEQALRLALTAAEKGWLLRTNEAKLSSAAAAALATDAGWAKAVGKALSSANVCCVGLELSLPVDEAQTLKRQVAQLGGHASDSEVAGKAFSTAGLDG
ncbi:hypothetical protein Vafri_7748 [Volvox africanus]|uniref:C-CAP/cofactor C-like domain-containing protein n=1 Tax=Volvox africanus TaxID=51714 RepID=A0A8J4B0W6_9CHLO|nr:hypothetical protein Vafri_7748 [Volvox africanus]